MKSLIASLALSMTALTMTPMALAVPTFGDDVAYLKTHTDVLELSDAAGSARIAVIPAWQGRVMTSTAAGPSGTSFGWLNRDLISSGKEVPHMNPYGGEDRVWLGPEGGQYSVYFAKGTTFEYANWFVPAAFDTLPFEVVGKTASSATFRSAFSLRNYSGAAFEVEIQRKVRLLSAQDAWRDLGLPASDKVSLVAYESDNTLFNRGKAAWRKDTGLLSIWILGMYTPSPGATIVVPIKPGPESELGVRVTSNYFGDVPPDRLKVTDGAVFLRADGKYRSKIGINPRRSRRVMGGYDADNRVLTIVQFEQPEGVTDYVNSLWKLQDKPFGGDVANAYNDGPVTPGAKPMGPFFEMESSSPAVELAPGASVQHRRRTLHLTGSEAELDRVARAVLGVSLDDIKSAWAR